MKFDVYYTSSKFCYTIWNEKVPEEAFTEEGVCTPNFFRAKLKPFGAIDLSCPHKKTTTFGSTSLVGFFNLESQRAIQQAIPGFSQKF
ncbi:hypothetical protein CEXT_492131 [Caerostris extrusa]|uniref:Uncharacterized protein n=1 Tax=Caerostris extrusa TaxID=172846 RepID=A0AAV4Y0B3_CAEEX|nr:hypothetical protein CEXT_492131 [Caerostris extrusa]